jgi:hypothetical protein
MPSEEELGTIQSELSPSSPVTADVRDDETPGHDETSRSCLQTSGMSVGVWNVGGHVGLDGWIES